MQINDHIDELNGMLQEMRLSLEGESKSSAGDKHETSRAMLHLEQEKLSSQLQEALLQQNALHQYEEISDFSEVHPGVLVNTDKGYIYLAVGLGKIKVDDTEVMVISQRSPLGMQMMGKKAGEEVKLNTAVFKILEIS